MSENSFYEQGIPSARTGIAAQDSNKVVSKK